MLDDYIIKKFPETKDVLTLSSLVEFIVLFTFLMASSLFFYKESYSVIEIFLKNKNNYLYHTLSVFSISTIILSTALSLIIYMVIEKYYLYIHNINNKYGNVTRYILIFIIILTCYVCYELFFCSTFTAIMLLYKITNIYMLILAIRFILGTAKISNHTVFALLVSMLTCMISFFMYFDTVYSFFIYAQEHNDLTRISIILNSLSSFNIFKYVLY